MDLSKKKVKVLELSRVSPPPGSVANTCLPLTLFDVLWLQFPPNQIVLFCQFSDPNAYKTSHFLDNLLPNLKHSLSLALQFFYPLCGKLTLSSPTGFHEIHYADGDSLSVCAAESSSDHAADYFHHLVSNDPKDAAEFDPFVPHLPAHSAALLSLQVTLFPNAGICIGLSQHHVVADGRSIFHFIKSWLSISRTGDTSLITELPIHDRELVKDPTGLKGIFSKQMAELEFWNILDQADARKLEKPLRVTFLVTRSDIEMLKQRVMSAAARHDKKRSFGQFSSFVVTCGYVWVCMIKARGYAEEDHQHKTVYFTFPVDCRTRLDPPIPKMYFGNCLTAAIAKATVSDLVGEDGLATASKAIVGAVEMLRADQGVLKGAEKLLPSFASLANERIVSISGSPVFGFNDNDFGWGRAIKAEVVTIHKTGDIYIADKASKEGGIELCLVLSTSEMKLFTSFFEEGLRSRQNHARL